MRRLAAFGVAGLAFSSAAWADSANFEISRASLDADALGIGVAGDATGVAGAVSIPLRGRLDIALEANAYDAEDLDESIYGGTLHVVGRNPGWMLGGFAGLENVDGADVFAGGAEGALYFERFTLAAVAAYLDVDEIGANGATLQAQGRYFLTRNLRFDASVGYFDIDAAGASSDALSYGGGAEFRFDETPISVFAAYNHIDADDFALDGDVARVGLRYNFDADLVYRDENGASFVTIPQLIGVL